MYPNLKLELWRKGIRQNRLAKELGIDESLLSRIVNGFRDPDPEMRAKIAQVLDRSERWLFETSEDTHPGAGLQDQVDKFRQRGSGCE
jgi:transcriptional regulator with XRE-family HTH domain